MRTIDADAFDATMYEAWKNNEVTNEEWVHFREMIKDEPTIEPQRWIPVKERLPKKDGRYQVTRYDYVTNTEFIDILWYEENFWWNRHSTGDYAVTAWMPLPESYKEGQE